MTSNVLEMHPQILKDKLRINKVIHKHFDPSIYSRGNLKAIKKIMKLDRSQSSAETEGLYKPYDKEDKSVRAILMKNKKKQAKSVNKREPTLAQVILDDFRMMLENDGESEDSVGYLQQKNRVTDIMDDYYSRHI